MSPPATTRASGVARSLAVLDAFPPEKVRGRRGSSCGSYLDLGPAESSPSSHDEFTRSGGWSESESPDMVADSGMVRLGAYDERACGIGLGTADEAPGAMPLRRGSITRPSGTSSSDGPTRSSMSGSASNHIGLAYGIMIALLGGRGPRPLRIRRSLSRSSRRVKNTCWQAAASTRA